MLTRIEIDGFKSFEDFGLDLRPLTGIVGPNASGKSNLFDALRFLALLAQSDIGTAMRGLRGEPEELFRRTSGSQADRMVFAVEVALPPSGVDAFGKAYEIPAQRLRYELTLRLAQGSNGNPKGVFVQHEFCKPISRTEEREGFPRSHQFSYGRRRNPFIEVDTDRDAILVRMDGPQRHGNPMPLPLKEASRTALSTIATAEFPHLYALREALTGIRFLEINPRAARGPSDRFEDRALKPDASNLAAVLTYLKERTATERRPDGVLADIAADLAALVPSVRRLHVRTDPNQRQYAFSLEFTDDLEFTSRVISDGTLRLLALLAILNDPDRRGTLCFEEPENGVHEGRVPMLVQFLRNSVDVEEISQPSFQVLLATHSPKVMASLQDDEIVAADRVASIGPADNARSTRTRMRSGVQVSAHMFDPELQLTRSEVERLLKRTVDAA